MTCLYVTVSMAPAWCPVPLSALEHAKESNWINYQRIISVVVKNNYRAC